MGSLVSSVTTMVRQMAPLHTTAWSDAKIKRAIHFADMEVREEAEVEWDSDTIELVDGAYYYTLPADAVKIRSVEFLRDGVTHDCMLQAITIPEMDDVSLSWQDDVGSTPQLFSVFSVPGTSRYSKIMIWPAISSTSGEKVRVNYVKYRKGLTDIDGVEMPDDVMRSVYLPLVLAILYSEADLQEAAQYKYEGRLKLQQVRARYTNKAQ